jgi:cysteine desulfurase
MQEPEIYLDNAATTRPYAEVVEAVADTLRENFGNPSSTHACGNRAKAALEHSRTILADALHVSPREIYFTSGATESNNLALMGACLAWQNQYRSPNSKERCGNLITTALEHPSVTKTVRNLKRQGWHVDYIDAPQGNLDLTYLKSILSEQTTLLSVMNVQNELGYVFPVVEVAKLRDRQAGNSLLHVDAVQAFGKLDFYPQELGADLASISAHKIGGPKGVGALYVRKGIEMFTTAFGGGQERGLRSGTESLPLIVGFARAVKIATAHRQAALATVANLKRETEDRLKRELAEVVINSRADGSPYILNFSIPDVDNKAALKYLSKHGTYISIGSACEANHSNVPAGTWREKSPLVLELAGIPKHLRDSTFRISFSANNTSAEIKRLVALLKQSFRKT